MMDIAMPEQKGEPMRLIDADALKADYGMKDDCADCEKELRGKVKSCEYEHIYTKMDFCGWIDSMPTIEECKTGKWIIGYDGLLHCSRCSTTPINRIIIGTALVYDITPIQQKMKFCPNCGVRMEVLSDE